MSRSVIRPLDRAQLAQIVGGENSVHDCYLRSIAGGQADGNKMWNCVNDARAAAGLPPLQTVASNK